DVLIRTLVTEKSETCLLRVNLPRLPQNRDQIMMGPRILIETSLSRTSRVANMEAVYKHDFLPSRTATCISATPKPYASISDWRRSLAASAICVLTTPIRQKKKQSM